jgi:hypothetical protein
MDKKVEYVKFNIARADLLVLLKNLRVATPGRISHINRTPCEITITEGKITIAVAGGVFSAEAETIGTCKSVLYFMHLYQVVKDDKKALIEGKLEEKLITINGTSFYATSTFFENDRILRTIDLPMNYTVADLVRLSRENYTWEEFIFNKISAEVQSAKRGYELDMKAAYKKLKVYGVKWEDIETITEKRLYNK